MVYTVPPDTNTNLPPPLTHASVQSRSVILASLCISIIFAWLAPHILSLIVPSIVEVAAAANEAKPVARQVSARLLKIRFICSSPVTVFERERHSLPTVYFAGGRVSVMV